MGLNWEGLCLEFLGEKDAPTFQEIIELIPVEKRIIVRTMIFHVTEGPLHQPNGSYKAIILRPSDVNGFFVVESVERKEMAIVHQNNIRLLWSDNLESRTSSGGTTPVPSPEPEPIRDMPPSRSAGKQGPCTM